MRGQNKRSPLTAFSQIALLVLAVHSIAACATETVYLRMVQQGTLDLKAKGIRSLAVSDFDGPEDSGKKVAELFTAKLTEGQYFKVVEREKLLALEKEQVLGMTGVVDQKMAAKAGKILGVDAIIVGKVSDWSVKDEPYTRTVMQSRDTGRSKTQCDSKGKCFEVPIIEEVPVLEHHHIRNSTVAVSYRVLKTETGEVLAGKEQTEHYKYDTGNPPSAGFLKGTAQEVGKEAVRSALAQVIIEKLVAQIQPHPVTAGAVFETGGFLFSNGAVMHGINLIRANRAQDAVQYYKNLVKNDPQNSSAHFNLGIAYELMNDYDRAEQAYRAAERINPKPLYIQAVGLMKKAREMNLKFIEAVK